MASAYISNALQINFYSVLGIQDNDGMLNMFKALEDSGLRGFLGCPSVLYEQELEQFFDTAIVQDGDITCAVLGKYVEISESRFAGVFNLPTDGLTDLSEVPNHLVMQTRNVSARLVKIKWSKILFDVLKEMADRTIKRAKGFAAQICVLLEGNPAITLGKAKTFPPFKIISEKTVNTYVATNKTIDSRGDADEHVVAKVKIINKKVVSKKRPAVASDAPAVKKKRTKSGKDAQNEEALALTTVAQEAVPLQIIAPSSVVPAETESAIEKVAEEQRVETAVDQIIAQIISETSDMETDERDPIWLLSLLEQPSPSNEETSVTQLDSLVDPPLGTDAPVDQISLPTAPTTDAAESFTTIRASISRIFLITRKILGDLAFQSLIKSVRQESQNQADITSIELKSIQAQNVVLMTDLADTRKEVQELKAAFSNDILDFPVARSIHLMIEIEVFLVGLMEETEEEEVNGQGSNTTAVVDLTREMLIIV
ncbi:hypothetical protein F511_20558 [Dorcoceras hygrometricum]|uniref:Dystroglycan-like n=1 Tax=Dorcoceras hygrometricum TaxID=472368 RepID=A0A2Z7CXB4_9LAMI|nr:hypothetical protein F511_20558 [Dorcoceras hygrometricum]